MNKLKNANGNKPLTQEQITDKMYMGEPVKDNRPLTDEALEELGFEKKGIKGMEYWQYEYADDNYLVAKRDPNYAVPYVCGIEYVDKPICKTVGSVKLLIEALKGDE